MRVIALTDFKDGKVDHPYGEEFDAPASKVEGKDGWLAKGLVRIDDRRAGPAPAAAPKPGTRPSGSTS